MKRVASPPEARLRSVAWRYKAAGPAYSAPLLDAEEVMMHSSCEGTGYLKAETEMSLTRSSKR